MLHPGANNYNQEAYIQDQVSNPAFNGIQSSSYSSHPGSTPQLSPLARIPSPDPEQIDGLHQHHSHSLTSQHSGGNSGIAAAGVYDTFSSAVYDRRSEPVTWSHLTPTLVQRIKDELNSYKMEIIHPDICSYTGRPQTRKNEMSGQGRYVVFHCCMIIHHSL